MNSCPISVSLIISGFATQLFFLAAAAQGIPTITRQPVGLSRSLGDKASLRVTATGDEPLSYQWYRNGLPLQDSTNQLLTLTNLTRTNSGRYTVEVSNAAGKVNSEAASVDVDTLFVFVTDTPISKNSSTSGGSVAWRDFDGDGRIDLLVSGTTAPLLFHNDGDGRFTRILAPNPVVSRTYGVDNGFAMWVDYDNDGRPDIYIVTGESPIDEPDYLFRNLGDGRFEPVVNAMTKRFVSSMSASWGDFNGDGRLDVFLGNVTSSLQARPSELWFGQADGAFRQASDQEFPGLSRQNFGSTVLDFDLDGKVDVIVATNPGGLPIAYKNQGGSGFDPITLSGGGGFIGTVASGDYDNDGLPDLFVTYAEKVCRLYHNDGDGQFSIVTGQPVSEEPGRSTGANWGDYDNDGWLDLFLPRNTFYTSNGSNDDSLWHNNGDGTFTRIQAGSVGADGLNSWAAAWGDYNNDGFLDLVVACESANRLYRNGGNTNAWLMLKLIGTASNRDAIGARIRVRSAIGGQGDPRRVAGVCWCDMKRANLVPLRQCCLSGGDSSR